MKQTTNGLLVAVDSSDAAVDVLNHAYAIAPDADSVEAITVIIPLAQVLVTPETSQMGWSTAELSKDIRQQTEAKLKSPCCYSQQRRHDIAHNRKVILETRSFELPKNQRSI